MSASACAAIALALFDCVPPPAEHGVGKPVIEVPGLTPTAPVVVVEPVQVTPAPPSTEYPAEPTKTGEVAARTLVGTASTNIDPIANAVATVINFFIFQIFQLL
ncbi:MAG TPA: hypothetical protein VMW80_01445 [Candidatus Dormibacteraeota bacterium]|nr:hypothetical protein [Candidatus Dormibacteraeota bacterium]